MTAGINSETSMRIFSGSTHPGPKREIHGRYRWVRFGSLIGSLTMVVAACGGADDVPAGSPVLRVLEDQILVANAVGSPGSQMSSARLSSQAFFEFEVSGELAVLGGTGAAYAIERSEPSQDQLDRLRATFGVTEPFVEQPVDVGGGLLAGPTDGTAPLISVMDDVMRTWSFSAAWAEAIVQECLSTPVTEGTGEVSSDCPPPAPPQNIPTQAEAEQKFATLMDELGVPVDGLIIETSGDELGVTVNGYEAIDGVRSPFTWSVSFGENGSVQSAFGVLNDRLRTLGEYPRLSTEEALTRLRAEQAAVAEQNGIEPVNGQKARVTAVEEEFYILYGADGEVYLVPGYTFIGQVDQGDYALRFIVSALPDGFVEKVPNPVPVADGGDSSIGSDVTGTDVVPPDVSMGGEIPLEQANELLGLTEADATSTAEGRGWEVRIAARDGEQFALTMDYIPTRVNLTIEAGVVTYLFIG